jgi:hypothetical protein
VATLILLVSSNAMKEFCQSSRGIWRTQELRTTSVFPVKQQDQKFQPNVEQKEILSSLGMCE